MSSPSRTCDWHAMCMKEHVVKRPELLTSVLEVNLTEVAILKMNAFDSSPTELKFFDTVHLKQNCS